MTSILGANEILTTREFEVPREKVYEAWTDPEKLARWWGPLGFTNTFHEFDFRPGGSWHFIMHGPNGADYPNHIVFEEIVPLERIVFEHIPVPEFRVTAIFEELDGRTRITYRQFFKKPKEFELVKSIGLEGNEQLFDRLKELLTDL